jgi:polar amino acid transport system permease protein
MLNDLRFNFIFNDAAVIIDAMILTLKLTLFAIILSTFLGIMIVFIRRKFNQIVENILSVYIEIMRNVPLLVLLYFIYFGLGELSINFGSLGSIILALVLCNGAYISEIFRAGIESIPKSQYETGIALGLKYYQVFFRIIFPQAFIKILPNLINQYVILMLSTSFASLVALDELTSTISRLSSFTFRTFEYYIIGALIYLLFTIVIASFSRFLEKNKHEGNI